MDLLNNTNNLTESPSYNQINLNNVEEKINEFFIMRNIYSN